MGGLEGWTRGEDKRSERVERDGRKGGQKEEWTRISEQCFTHILYRRSLYVCRKTRISNLGKSPDFRNIKILQTAGWQIGGHTSYMIYDSVFIEVLAH